MTCPYVCIYTWAAINTHDKVIDRYDDDAKRRANLLNLRLNRDIGERTVIGAMVIHKHQGERDLGLLSLNGRVGLGRDWIATGQVVGNSTGDNPHFAYYASTDWRNESGFSGFLSLKEIRNGFRPNETGLEDEAFRRSSGVLTYRNEYSEDSQLNALVLHGRLHHQPDKADGLRNRYAQADVNFDVGRLNFNSFVRVGEQREAGRLWSSNLAGVDLDYVSTWGFVSLFNQIGKRQDHNTWFTSLSGSTNLFNQRMTVSTRSSTTSSAGEPLLLRPRQGLDGD